MCLKIFILVIPKEGMAAGPSFLLFLVPTAELFTVFFRFYILKPVPYQKKAHFSVMQLVHYIR